MGVLLKDDEIQPLSAEKCEQNDKQTGSEEVPMKTLTAEQTNVFTDAGTDQNPRPESNLSALPDIEAVELHKGESKKSAEAKNQIDVELDLLMEEISHSEGT